MPSPYEKQLTTRATRLIQQLQAVDIHAQIMSNSLRDYQIALTLPQTKGILNIFYSPKRDFYTLTMAKVNESLKARIQAVWDSAASDQAQQAITQQSKSAHQAFVDGSFHNERKQVGYGAVILHQGQEVQRLSGRVYQYMESHQIAGELSATMQVIRWCQENNITQIDIFYDYVGIEKWATGKFKAEKPMSAEYVTFMRQSGVRVHWHKVESHSGVYWNEVADQLAKAGALLP